MREHALHLPPPPHHPLIHLLSPLSLPPLLRPVPSPSPSPHSNLQEFVEHIVSSTNMRSLSPISALDASCNFLAANLYAKSIFGEDALVNVSVENRADGSIKGHIRIRSKTQGVALSLGDKITETQRRRKKPLLPAA
jgi:hypothetical protein